MQSRVLRWPKLYKVFVVALGRVSARGQPRNSLQTTLISSLFSSETLQIFNFWNLRKDSGKTSQGIFSVGYILITIWRALTYYLPEALIKKLVMNMQESIYRRGRDVMVWAIAALKIYHVQSEAAHELIALVMMLLKWTGSELQTQSN